MKPVLLAITLLLAACSSEGQRAEQQLAMLDAHQGTPRERCATARRAADAYLRDNDGAAYDHARIVAQAECSAVDAFPAYADVPGGMPKATDAEIAGQLAQLNQQTK